MVEYHTDMVYSVAYGIMGNAQDACQEVFLRLFRAAPTLPMETRLRSYLCRVCVNYCLDQLRRKSRQVTTDSIEEATHLRSRAVLTCSILDGQLLVFKNFNRQLRVSSRFGATDGTNGFGSRC